MTVAEGRIVPMEPSPRWAEVLPESPSILVAPGLARASEPAPSTLINVDEGWEDVNVDDTVTVVIDIVESTDFALAAAAAEDADAEMDQLALGTVDRPGGLRLPDRNPTQWVGPKDKTQVIDVSEVLDSRAIDDAPRKLAPGMVPVKRGN
jgi:hypothetical protein